MFKWLGSLFSLFRRTKELPRTSSHRSTGRPRMGAWIETIAKLEEILSTEEDFPIEIMPNGEIRTRHPINSLKIGKRPLTMREDLGGEYAY